VAAGQPLDAIAERAVVAVESATGRAIARSGRDSSGELSNILLVADLVAVLCTALHNVDGDIGRESLVAGIEQIDAMPSASGGRLTFRPGEHWGCRELRQIEWREGLWRVVSDYQPIHTWTT